MSARYPVKWYTQEMQGAPKMTGGKNKSLQQPGQLTALLKQVLVTGFGLLAVDSLTYDSASGEVTATISGGHKYLKDSVLLIEGANEAAFNGEQRVTFVNATQFRYVPATPPAVAAATGTFSAKVAPAGWEVLAENTSGEVMVFGSTDPSAGNTKLLVNNSASTPSFNLSNSVYADVLMVEDVTSVEVFSKICEGVWPASHFYSDNHEWQLIADDKIFYISIKYGAKELSSTLSFGELNSVRPNDLYSAVINYAFRHAYMSDPGVATNSSFLNHEHESERFLSRKYHQISGATSWKTLGLLSRMGTGIPLPNPADNGFYIGVDKVPVVESDGTLRGYLPGIVNPYNDHPGLVDRNHHGIQSFPGKIIRFVKGAYNETSGPTAQYTKQSESLIGFDLTGPWR